MPTHNVELYVGDAIESIINQTISNWELLITDDCSSDNTWAVLNKYAELDKRIKIFQLDNNSGAGIARNNSIEKSTGRYIAFCDSDDWWYPFKLEIQYEFMTRNNYEFVFSACEFANSDLEVIGISWKRLRINKRILLFESNVGTPGVIYDTKRIGKIYFPPIRKRQDWVMWLRLIEETKYMYSINWPLWKVRIREGSLSSKKMNLIKYNYVVYNKYLKYSKFKSFLFLFFGYIPNYFFRQFNNKVKSKKYIKLYKPSNTNKKTI